MNGVEHPHLRVLVQDTAYAPENGQHGLSQIFPPVGGQQHEPGTLLLRPGKLRVGIIPPDCLPQCVNGGVAGNVDFVRVLALPEKGFLRPFRWGEEPGGQAVHRLPVEFLREGGGDVVGTQPRLHMSYRHSQIEGGQSRGKSRGGIAVNQHRLRPFPFQNGLHPFKNLPGNVKEGLPRLHDGKVIVRLYLKALQHLLQHLPMLAGDADQGFKVGSSLQLPHQRAHFDCLRPGTEDQHDFFLSHP